MEKLVFDNQEMNDIDHAIDVAVEDLTRLRNAYNGASQQAEALVQLRIERYKSIQRKVQRVAAESEVKSINITCKPFEPQEQS